MNLVISQSSQKLTLKIQHHLKVEKKNFSKFKLILSLNDSNSNLTLLNLDLEIHPPQVLVGVLSCDWLAGNLLLLWPFLGYLLPPLGLPGSISHQAGPCLPPARQSFQGFPRQQAGHHCLGKGLLWSLTPGAPVLPGRSEVSYDRPEHSHLAFQSVQSWI